ncbi:unnamed protein product, partial [Choristocarpus tenellus]
SGPTKKRPRLLEEAVETSTIVTPVPLGFSPDFFTENKNLLLLQVSESLLEEIAEDCDSGLVHLVGEEDQEAVLVTGKQSFKITKAETSNTLLLVPPIRDGSRENLEEGDAENGRTLFQASASVGFQFELAKASPSLQGIRKILEKCLYWGGEAESAIDHGDLDACTLEALQERLQFSQKELQEGLAEVGALEIGGKQEESIWRLVDPVLMEQIADMLLNLVVQEDMPLDKIDPEACVLALPECERLVVEHCLSFYSRPTNPEGLGKVWFQLAHGTRELDLDAVARLRAHQLLRAHPDSHDKGWDLEDFTNQWASTMPGVDTPDLDLLKGIAVVENKPTITGKPSVVYIPAQELPFLPKERLAALFRIRPRWPMGELEPYIS